MIIELREQIASCFAELKDPRQPTNQAHLFLDILVISICAIVCGADYAEAKEEWLMTFPGLLGVTPFGASFASWVSTNSSVVSCSGTPVWSNAKQDKLLPWMVSNYAAPMTVHITIVPDIRLSTC